MQNKKVNQTRLAVILIVLVGVLVAFFALQGSSEDLQGRFSSQMKIAPASNSIQDKTSNGQAKQQSLPPCRPGITGPCAN